MAFLRRKHVLTGGERFDHWTVVREVDPVVNRHGDRHRCVLCHCDCGAEHVVRLGNLVAGRSRSCRRCAPRKTRERQFTNGEVNRNSVYSVYKRKARDRGLAFALTKEELFDLVVQPCHYSGALPSNVFDIPQAVGPAFRYSGFDRVDPAKGYVRDTVVPACIVCNRAKSNMDVAEFYDWIDRIVAHRTEGSSHR